MRSECLELLNLDIIGIAETHLKGSETLSLPGYVWFGQNRQKLHAKAKRGSGGIGCFVRTQVLQNFKVDIIDSSHEGIMWLHFQPTTDTKAFYFCVCYLPPSDSTRNIDHGEFYDTLLYQSFSHCNDELFYICGDFSGRCGDLEDYIAGVDCIPDRDVIDYTINKEGERLCDCLIDSNCCIMNGRNCLENNFTFVGTQGASVVDYCITPYELLSKYEAFRVCLTSDLLSKANLHNKINSATTVPDHSLLLWTFTVECTNVNKKKYAIGEPFTYEKYDRLVPDNFLQEDLSNTILNDGIRNIQQSVNKQEELDNVCSKLILTLKTEMNDKMTHRTVKIQPSGNNKKRKVNKPWWSDSLSELWNEQCKAEKAMLKGQKSMTYFRRHQKTFQQGSTTREKTIYTSETS